MQTKDATESKLRKELKSIETSKSKLATDLASLTHEKEVDFSTILHSSLTNILQIKGEIAALKKKLEALSKKVEEREKAIASKEVSFLPPFNILLIFRNSQSDIASHNSMIATMEKQLATMEKQLATFTKEKYVRGIFLFLAYTSLQNRCSRTLPTPNKGSRNKCKNYTGANREIKIRLSIKSMRIPFCDVR